MNDKYVRPPMGDPAMRVGLLDIIVLVISVICLLAVLMWAAILMHNDVEIPEEATVNTVAPIISEQASIDMKMVELGAFESPVLTEKEEVEEVIEEPTVAYYDVPLDEQLQDHIFAVCEEYRIDPALVIAVIERESKYRDWVKGDNGNSYGLMQIQPRWHRDRMNKLGVTNLLDPYQNVLVGVDYLAELFERCEDVEWVLMAYNGGPSYANQWYGRGVVSKYATGVLEGARELRTGVDAYG